MFKTRQITFNHGKIGNIYIVYEIKRSVNISSYLKLENCLFGAVDVDLYKYSGYGIGFDRKGSYSIGNEVGRNVIILGVDMSLFSHIDNKKSWYRSCTRIRTYTDCRKIVLLNQLY